MKALVTALCRLYRLGLCASLIIIDIVLLSVFVYDLVRFANDGYSFEVLKTLPEGSNLLHAALDGVTTLLLLLILLPLVVATFRIVVTRLRLPNISLSPLRLFVCHVLFTGLLCVCVMAGFRMQVASGDKYDISKAEMEGYEYSAKLEVLPAEAEAAIHQSPDYIQHHKWQYLLRLLVLLFLFMTGREIMVTQRKFIADYISASHLVDVDANFLPNCNAARQVTTLRPCAPLSDVMQATIEREVRAFDRGKQGSYDLCELATRTRAAINDYLFENTLKENNIRLMPNALSCVYTAMGSESSKAPVILSPLNHPGLNDFIKAWFVDRSISCLEIEEKHLFESWEVQETCLIESLERQTGKYLEEVVVVLPLVSRYTGQSLDTERLVTKIKQSAKHAVIILDASFVNVQPNSLIKYLSGIDYLCFNVSQWIGCSETCGVLITKRDLPADRSWEQQMSFAPENIRTLSAFLTALQHSFRKSVYFNDPQARFKILYDKFNDDLDIKRVVVATIPSLTELSYFLTVQPAAGKKWNSTVVEEITRKGLQSGVSTLRNITRFTVAIPPYTDYWQVGQFAKFLNQSVV